MDEKFNLADTVKIKTISDDGKKGIFHIEGLYTGYGLTLGNALRRVLLSSLPGAAVTQVKIKGVPHEFTSIPGMKEDILEFTLNLKKVRFKFFADQPQVLTLKIKGEKQIKASDIKTTAQVEIANPKIHLADLTDKKAVLDAELTVEKGLGYSPAAKRKLQRLVIGTIVLDAIFSPIERITFSVEDMRLRERTDYNRLKLNLETDGTISPSQAMNKAVNILKEHFEKIIIKNEKGD